MNDFKSSRLSAEALRSPNYKFRFGDCRVVRLCGLLAMTILFLFSASTQAAQSSTITIGSKNFTEQAILGELLAQLIEDRTNLKVDRKFFLGGSQFTFQALKMGEIDIYPEYTGTGLVTILKMDPGYDAQETYNIVKKAFEKRYQIAWLKPFGFNNTYAMAVRPDDSRMQNISTLSELVVSAPQLIFGAPHEFFERKDGFDELSKTYNFKFKKSLGLDPGIMYTALLAKNVDIITGFSTDGRIAKFNLSILKDDKGFFPPYFAAPLVRVATLKAHPAIKDVLNLLAGKISDVEMTRMNFDVDLLGKTAAQVAKEFLIKKNLITPPTTTPQNYGTTAQENLLDYFYSQRTYLFYLTLDHLFLVIIALFIAMVIGIPTGIMLTRFRHLKGPVFALVNTIQTIPSIALLGALIPLIGIGVKPAIVALCLYALLPMVRNTYAGIQDIDPNLKEVAQGMGLTGFQILNKVELPLAMPMIMAGIRISTVIMVGTATLAALIGAGGLGDPIFRGISSVNNRLIMLGAVPAALLAITLDRILYFIERRMVKSRNQ